MRLNNKIMIKNGVKISDIEGKSQITFGDLVMELNPTEKMILHHCEDFDLKEISVVLREFYQMNAEQADKVLDAFVNRLSNAGVIDIVNSCRQSVIENDMIFKQNPQIELIEDDDETGILRDFDKGKMLFINKAGIIVWKFLEQAHCLEDILIYFDTIYNSNRDELNVDMREYIQTLIDKKYLLVEESANI